MGQGPAWIWAKNAAVTVGTSGAMGKSVATDVAGNIFVCGYYDNSSVTFGSTTLTNKGLDNLFIAKYDSGGTVLWAKGAGGTAGDEADGLAADGAGNVYVTGDFGSPTIKFGSSILTNNGQSNFFLVKYDINGNVLWARSAGGIGSGYGASGISVTVDNSGNVYATGGYFGPIIAFGSDTIRSPQNSSPVFLVKYDANGNELWARISGDTSYGTGYSVATDIAGNVLITGNFSSSHLSFSSDTLINEVPYGAHDMFIVKYDAAGNVSWARNSRDSGSATVASVAVDATGNAYVTGGMSNHSAVFGLDTLYIHNNDKSIAFLIKYDPSGNVLWVQGAETPHINAEGASGSGLTIAPNGNIY